MSGLRVIGGIARGRRLQSVPGDATRPITDRAKESLFNIIGPDIQEASLLDLFAGTGSVGIEALSRGAAWVCFIDKQRQAVETIRNNLRLTQLAEKAQVFQSDAFVLLDKPPDRSFDYIFIAPPQYKEIWLKALAKVDASPGWLAEGAWVIVQIHPVELEAMNGAEPVLQNLTMFDQRKYGSTLFLFYTTP